MGLSINAQQPLTAAEVLKKATDKITSSKGLTADFRADFSGKKISGKFISEGVRFSLQAEGIKVWYDGKNMWTYNQSTSETTLTSPNSDEINETNPLSYLKLYEKRYEASFSKESKSEKYVIQLLPKSKRDEYKSIVITINKSNYLPETIKGVSVSGQIISINLDKIKTGLTFTPGDFRYPASSYPKVEVIDMR